MGTFLGISSKGVLYLGLGGPYNKGPSIQGTKNKGPLDLLQGFLKGSMGLSIGVLLKGSIGRLKLPL